MILLLGLSCKCQVSKKFQSTSWGQTNWGYYYRPATPGKYPVVIFFHGSGEVGSDSLASRSLLNFGPLAFIKTGWKPNLVIFAIQVSYWSPAPDLCKYILDNDPDIQPFWDGSNILWTGLSAGGQRVLEAMALKYGGSFVPMSPAGIDFSRIDLSRPYRLWDFHSPTDNVCPYQYSQDLVNLLNGTFPGSAKLTPYSGGHSGWNTFYDPAYKNPVSIYEFGATNPAPPVKTPLCTIIVYTDGTTETKKN
jgi:predicted peptidase